MRPLLASLLLSAPVLVTHPVHADTIQVPLGGDIQLAIDGASDGDTIALDAGTYSPTAPIELRGKEVTLLGQTDPETGAPTSILDGAGTLQLLLCISSETPNTVIENLLIQNGLASNGGGMYCLSASPTLRNCTFRQNTATDKGGGFSMNQLGSPTFEGCRFEENSATVAGGGISSYLGVLTMSNCTFTATSFTTKPTTAARSMLSATPIQPSTIATFIKTRAMTTGGRYTSTFRFGGKDSGQRR